MKRIIYLLVFLLCVILTSSAQRIVNINHDWQFRHVGEKSWHTVSLPHDFQVSQPWVAPAVDEKADNSNVASNVKSRLSARGFKEMGQGEYLKTWRPDANMKGKRIVLDFEGIMLVGDVWLNGEHIGGTDYGYVGFGIDISDKLKYGQDNEIRVVANTMKADNSRWYTGGGLFRDVNVIITDKQLYFTRNSLQITTSGNSVVDISAEIGYFAPRADTLQVKTRILDADGKEVAAVATPVSFNRTQKINEHRLRGITLSNPHLWNLDTPYLYTAEISLYKKDGTLADRVSEHFGVRTIEFSPSCGFMLNGHKVLLKGIANHHTLGALGAAAFPRAIEKRIQLLKQFGVNHIRTSHNPYSKSLLDLCDKYGILVVDELYDKWTSQYAGGRTDWKNLWQNDIPEFVRRDRNHPSVIMWSLGNELQQIWDLPFHDWGVTIYRLQRDLLHRYDSTRLVTVAMHPRYRDFDNPDLPHPLARATDVASYNYRYMYFPGDGERYPNMMFYQSEASTAAMGPNFYEMNRDKVIGLAYWGLIDYLGESQGWPEKGWAQGVFDISLRPKPKAYLLKSMFVDEPVVHIGIIDKAGTDILWNGVKTSNDGMSENWNRRQGSKVNLYTYTNADEVELLVNGKSVGIKQNPIDDAKHRNQIYWKDITWQPGNIEAVARKAGKVVARHKLETTGKAVRLIAVADNSNWKADEQDLQHVDVMAVDSRGKMVPDYDGQIEFSVSGNATLAAVCNGDITTSELFQTTTHKMWHGRAMIILRSDNKPGKVSLNIKSAVLKSATIKFNTK